MSETAAELLDVNAVAALLTCSAKHVRRMSDAGKLPPPVRVGWLVRWRRCEIHQWIDAGCPPVRSVRAKAL
jgi:predicted DNA-binding transcriptional regulator AlpA